VVEAEIGPGGPEVFLTGATGFVGGHVSRALLASGYRVRALVRPASRPLPEVAGLTVVSGDVTRSGELLRSMEGCSYLMHVAALYSFAPAHRPDIRRTNVQGTAGILEAARIAGIEKAVVTSSSATVGPARAGRPATEAQWAVARVSDSRYHASKIEQERVALAAQVPVTLVLPTTPVGPGDWRPTPTGKMVVDFMKGRIFASLGGGLNLVAVEDVAAAHVSALENGRPGERYLVGGENLTLDELWKRLADICGRRAPSWRMPYSLAAALGWGDELRGRVTALAGRARSVPLVPLEGVQMAKYEMWVDDAKARAELGHRPTPVAEALERAVRWYHDHGYAA
jgi:dihydroflavonol-4-reductase